MFKILRVTNLTACCIVSLLLQTSPTSGPSSWPTTKPTFSPVTATEAANIATLKDALSEPQGNTDAVTITVTVDAEVTFQGVPCESDLDLLKRAALLSLRATQCGNIPATVCSVAVSKVALCGNTSSRRKLFRTLQSNALVVDFTTKILAYCQDEDCDNAEEVVAAVEAVVTKLITDSTQSTATTTTSSGTQTNTSPLLLELVKQVKVIADEQASTTTGSASPSLFNNLITALTDNVQQGAVAVQKAVAPLLASIAATTGQWYPGKNDWDFLFLTFCSN